LNKIILGMNLPILADRVGWLPYPHFAGAGSSRRLGTLNVFSPKSKDGNRPTFFTLPPL